MGELGFHRHRVILACRIIQRDRIISAQVAIPTMEFRVQRRMELL